METPYLPSAEGTSLEFLFPAESYDFGTQRTSRAGRPHLNSKPFTVSLLLVAPSVFHVFSEIVRDLIVVGRFGNRLFYFRARQIFEAWFQLRRGVKRQLGGWACELAVRISVHTIHRPEAHQKLFLVPLGPVPPLSNKVHGAIRPSIDAKIREARVAPTPDINPCGNGVNCTED